MSASLVIEMTWLGERIRTFRDLIPPNPRALFVGLNPSPVSLDAGHYHQGRLGKRMWRRLEDHRVIPQPPEGMFHDEWLYRLGVGLTDLVKRPSRRGDVLTSEDFAHGRARLLDLIGRAQPPLLCFVYKTAAEKALARRLRKPPGLLEDSLLGTPAFLLPGPYADNRTVRATLNALRGLLPIQGPD